MKLKLLPAIAIILLLCVAFASCNEVKDNSSADIGQSDLSDTPSTENSGSENVSEDSLPEESMPVADYSRFDGYVIGKLPEGEWYSQEDLDELIEMGLYVNRSAGSKNQRHITSYYGLEHHFVEAYFSDEEESKYFAMFDDTEYLAGGHLLEYYDIPWEDYIGFYTGAEYRRIMALGEYAENAAGTTPYANSYPTFCKEVWYDSEFWNDERFVPYEYTYAQLKDHYTHIEDRNGYTRYYYIIDRLLIQYVGEDEFNQWLDKTDDAQQNILKFIEDFEITREIYDEIFENEEYKAHNPDYLFGTPEMQDEYFKVHPLNKE